MIDVEVENLHLDFQMIVNFFFVVEQRNLSPIVENQIIPLTLSFYYFFK